MNHYKKHSIENIQSDKLEKKNSMLTVLLSLMLRTSIHMSLIQMYEFSLVAIRSEENFNNKNNSKQQFNCLSDVLLWKKKNYVGDWMKVSLILHKAQTHNKMEKDMRKMEKIN